VGRSEPVLIPPRRDFVIRTSILSSTFFRIFICLFAFAAVVTQTARAQWERKPYLPDPVLTPGAILPSIADDRLCTKDRRVRAPEIAKELEDEVFAAYGIRSPKPGQWKIDVLIPVELGGDPSNIKNLFPLPYSINADGSDLGANTKRLAEVAVLRQLCGASQTSPQKITFAEAREQFANNWPVLYREFVDKEFPPFYEPDINNYPKWKP
jgi:hypothetical protein